jgi:glycosyltransferase
MISLFIFKSNARGMKYGMGTYIRELTEALHVYTDVILYIVTYHKSECNEFSIETISSRYFKINIPSPRLSSHQNNLFEKRYSSIVVKLLSDVIPKDGDVVFQMNYIDDLPIIKKLKEKYKHKVISVVHCAQWQQLFNGNRQKLIGLNINHPENNIEFTLFNEKEMYHVSDRIVSITSYMKDFLVEHYGITPYKINIIPNGINFSRFQILSQEEKLKRKHNLGFSPYEKIILFSGRIDPGKGIFFLLDAFVDVCNHRDDLRLVLLGQGDIQECLAKYQSFYGKITFTGFLPSDQVMAFYQIADIGVVPSIYEQCPYTVLEMMAYKIPLILSRIDGLNEIFNEDQCVFIEPLVTNEGDLSFDKKEFSNAILALVTNNQRAKKIALNSYRNLINNFSSSRLATEMNNVYSSLIASKQNS